MDDNDTTQDPVVSGDSAPLKCSKSLIAAKEASKILMDEIGRLNAEIEHWKRLSFDMISLFHPSGKGSVATAERVEAWKQQWNELTGTNADLYLDEYDAEP